ncbi:hypothetical protein [Chryseobacterium paludis]|nr:hypothetical protein [Chryseobacterium paludis]
MSLKEACLEDLRLHNEDLKEFIEVFMVRMMFILYNSIYDSVKNRE